MSFLSKLFGSKKKQEIPLPEKEISLSLQELQNFLNSEISSSKKDFEKNILSKLSEVKHLRNELNKHLQELSSLKPAEGANLRLLKIFNTSKQQMLSRMNSLNQKLAIPSTSNLQELQQYCATAETALKQSVFSSGKSIAYTGFLLREQMKFLGKTVQELNSIFSELNSSFKKNQLLLIDFNAEVNELNNLLAEINSSKKEISSLKKQLHSAEENLSLLDSSLDELNKSEEARKLHSIEEQIIKCNAEFMDLKNHCLAVFSSVERPFKKLKNFAEKNPGTLTHKQTGMLESYLDDAFLALKTDLQAKKLFFLLNCLQKLINSNEIEFSEKEKEKTLKAIASLQQLNFFEEFFWKENSLKKKLQELEPQKSSIKITEKINSKQEEKKLLESELKQLKESIKSEKNTLKKLEEDFFYKKQSLQNAVKEATNKDILIEIKRKKTEKNQ